MSARTMRRRLDRLGAPALAPIPPVPQPEAWIREASDSRLRSAIAALTIAVHNAQAGAPTGLELEDLLR